MSSELISTAAKKQCSGAAGLGEINTSTIFSTLLASKASRKSLQGPGLVMRFASSLRVSLRELQGRGNLLGTLFFQHLCMGRRSNLQRAIATRLDTTRIVGKQTWVSDPEERLLWKLKNFLLSSAPQTRERLQRLPDMRRQRKRSVVLGVVNFWLGVVP